MVGPSGSGKSSAVKAGLLPAIRRGAVPLSGSWFTIEMTPATHPFEQLEEALLGVAVDPPPSLLEQLAGDQGLQRAVNRVLPHDGSQLLLLIDQFEELYTQVDPATANRFLANLVSAVTDEQSRIRVVATLRADFYDRPLQHRGLGELLRDGTEIVTPMTAHDLERAITCPAEPHGITFEPAVVAALVREVTDRPGALPLLQYTLTELFDHRRGDRVDYATYEELGGVSGTLVKRAEGLLASLGDEAHEVARQVFLRLVTFNEGGEDTRRRVLRSELEDLDVDRLVLRSVLDTFGRHRLLSFDRDPITRSPTVEISHEALLTEWTRLRDWIDGARHDVRVQRRLAEAMREWIAADRADAYLLEAVSSNRCTAGSPPPQCSCPPPNRPSSVPASPNATVRRTRPARTRAPGGRGRTPPAAARSSTRRRRSRGRPRGRARRVRHGAVALGARRQGRRRRPAHGRRSRQRHRGPHSIDDPELALLLAMQSVRETVDLGFATEEAVDAVHFALQELGVQYDVDPGTPVAVRPGPHGPVGVYALPPNELMETRRGRRPRTLTDAECEAFLSGACPAADRRAREPAAARRVGLVRRDRPGPQALAGTSVTISASGLDADTQASSASSAEFIDRTGIAVEFDPDEARTTLDFEPDEPDRRPDVFVGGAIPAWAEARAMDIGRFVDPETLRSDFGEYLLSVGTSDRVGGAPAGGRPSSGDSDRRRPEGPRVLPEGRVPRRPGTRSRTRGTSSSRCLDQIVADGGTPWCFGFESGPGTGWPGTDFIESLVLRVGGVDTYDAWTTGEVGFTSAAVMEAGRLADDLIFEPGFVRGGPATISEETGTRPDQLHAARSTR